MYVDDSGQRLDRGADLGVDAEATGDRYLDLALGQVEHHRHATAAAGRLAAHQALQSGERTLLAEKHAQPGRGVGHDIVERLDLLRGQPQIILLAAYIDGDRERLAGVEQSSRLAQHLGEQGHFEDTARV